MHASKYVSDLLDLYFTQGTTTTNNLNNVEHNLYPIDLPINFKIERVIFNKPATIVYWEDGTKTVVKCQKGDTYNKEQGLALCFAKKALGNKGNFNEVFKKYCEE